MHKYNSRRFTRRSDVSEIHYPWPENNFRTIRDYFVANGLKCFTYPGKNLVNMRLPSMLYSSAGGQNKARIASQNATSCSDSSPSHSHWASAISAQSQATGSNCKMDDNISIRFKTQDRFSRKIGEDLKETTKLYMDAAMRYELSTKKCFKLFINIFEGNFQRFCRIKVETKARNFADACLLLRNELCRLSKQNRVKRFLDGLWLNKITREK